MNYNSPYGISDIFVPDGAFPSEAEEFTSQRDGRPICRYCFFGMHSHEKREPDGRISSDSQDCKILLWKWKGDTTEKERTGQCCCTWHEVTL